LDKIFIFKVGLELIEGEEVRPGGWSFQGAGMHCIKQILIDNVKLRADVNGA
jgi:hypothetical protein